MVLPVAITPPMEVGVTGNVLEEQSVIGFWPLKPFLDDRGIEQKWVLPTSPTFSRQTGVSSTYPGSLPPRPQLFHQVFPSVQGCNTG